MAKKSKKKKLRRRVPIITFIVIIVIVIIIAVFVPFIIIYKIDNLKDWNNFQKDFKKALPTLEAQEMKKNPTSTLVSSKLKTSQYYKVIYEDVFDVKNNAKGTTLTVDFEARFSRKTVFNINEVIIKEKWEKNYHYFNNLAFMTNFNL